MGACRVESVNVSVRWDFPGLWRRSVSESWLPTYLTHVFGSTPPIARPFEMNLACADIENREAVATRVDVTVRTPGFGDEATRSVMVSAGGRQRVCVNPGWNRSRLGALRSIENGAVEVYARLPDGREVSRAMRPFSALPANAVVWDEIRDGTGRPIWWEDGGALSTVFVTPNDPAVLSLRRAAEARSRFPGGFGVASYQRSPYTRTQNIPVNDQSWERFALEAGESLEWALSSVAGGSDRDIDVYLFTEDQYLAWRPGTASPAARAWANQTTGARGSFTAPTASWYRLVLYNTSDNFVSRDVTWARSNTRFDVAYDALRSIFDELRARGTTYVHINQTYWEGFQLIRRPSESLAMGAANCIDGTFLFASVLENIGMEPWIVLLPGHAIVGVSSSPGSSLSWAIETTQVGDRSATAFSAFLFAGEYIQRMSTAATWVSVRSARASGIRPVP